MKKLFLALTLLVVASPVFAAGKYSIKEMTPQVKAALDGRKERFSALEALKQSGSVGENNKGYVQVLKEEDSAAEIVTAENKDRKLIYQTIANQNGLEDALSTIETVFAQVQRDKADTGEKIQAEDGQWIIK